MNAGRRRRGTPCADHAGNAYPSKKAMAEAYGQSPATVVDRLENGWSLEDALTVPANSRPTMKRAITDHKGKTYRTRKEMCDAYGITPIVLRKRLKNGADLAAALETPVGMFSLPCTDHLGNEFPSISAMCRFHGVNHNSFQRKHAKGLPLKECLSAEKQRWQACLDWAGREYPSIAKMAAALHVPNARLAYYSRQRGGAGPETAAYAVSRSWPGTDAGPYVILSCQSFPWFLCQEIQAGRAGCNVIMHADALLELKSGRAADKAVPARGLEK